MPYQRKLSVLEREMLEVIRENPGITNAEASRRVEVGTKSGSSVVFRLRVLGLVKPGVRDSTDPRWGKCWPEDDVDISVFE